MSDAPERIWVDFEPRDWPSERIMYGDMPEPYAEYIRADLAAPDLAELVEAATAFSVAYRTWSLIPRRFAHEKEAFEQMHLKRNALDDVLAKIKEPQT